LYRNVLYAKRPDRAYCTLAAIRIIAVGPCVGASRSVVADGGSQPEGNAPDRILLFIQENPSCHLRRIKKELGLAMGTVQYHLDRLEKAGKITSQRHSLHKYYFAVGFQENEKQLLEVLSNETAREILMFIVERKSPTQTEIGEHVGIAPASVSWHIKRLEESKIIDEIREGRFKRYRLADDSRLVAAMLKNFYPTIWDRWSNRLAEMFLSMSSAKEEGK
jgi:DNA-binding transcriptional ArsR family regulator